MPARLLSVIESPRHPNFSPLYQQLGIEQQIETSVRKALKAVKKHPPDILVAEFIYGYGNNYAGVNISNLDVLLVSLQRTNKACRVILLADKKEAEYAPKLSEIYPVHAILTLPVDQEAFSQLLTE